MDLTDRELVMMLQDRLRKNDNTKAFYIEALRELQNVSQKLRASERLKSNFLSNVRNEINNPLSSILGLSKMLASAHQRDFEQFKTKAILLHEEAFQLDCKMRNIIAAAELEAGEMRPNRVQVDIRDLISTTADSFAFKCDRKQLVIRLDFDLPSGDIFITDPQMLFVLIMNLIANAVEFSEGGKEIFISVTRESELIVLVKDSGRGIPQEDRKLIFDRFRQLDEGSTKRHSGQGLGLSVARELAEVLGGKLVLKASGNDGSIFELSIPSHQALDARHVAVTGWNEMLFGNEEIL